MNFVLRSGTATSVSFMVVKCWWPVYFVVIPSFTAEGSGGVIAKGEKTAELSANGES